jgi:hypothetical protein
MMRVERVEGGGSSGPRGSETTAEGAAPQLFAARALAKRIDLGFEGSRRPLWIDGVPLLESADIVDWLREYANQGVRS